MKSTVFFGLSLTIAQLLTTTLMAQAESSTESTCRSKAKELAMQTYSDCVMDSKKASLDQIKAEYKEDLNALKEKFDKRIKSIEEKPTTSEPAKIDLRKLEPSKGASYKSKPARKTIAKTLPPKKIATVQKPMHEDLAKDQNTVVLSTPESDLDKQSATPWTDSERDETSTYAE